MFDVLWTDPDRELVGERRAKKEEARERKVREQEIRSSISTRASSSSSDKAFSFFGSKSLRKAKTKRSNPPSTLASPTFDTRSLRSSIFGAPLSTSARSSSERDNGISAMRDGVSLSGAEVADVDSHMGLDQGEFLSNSPRGRSLLRRRDKEDDVPTLSPPECGPWAHSVKSLFLSPDTDSFSKSTVRSAASASSSVTTASAVTSFPSSPTSVGVPTTKTSFIQELGPSSFVTRSTEVIVTLRTEESEAMQHLVRQVSIKSGSDKDALPTPPVSPFMQNL